MSRSLQKHSKVIRLLVVSQILAGSFAQEEMPLRTNFKPVWDSGVTEKLSYPTSVTTGSYTH